MILPLALVLAVVAGFVAGFFSSQVLEKRWTWDNGYDSGFKHGYDRRKSDEQDERTKAYVDARMAGKPKLHVVKDE